ncbi:MAG: hypothetical protein ACXWQR_19905 [Ktedonobacterales bacterium]
MRIDDTWPGWTGTIRVVIRDRRGRFAKGGGTFKNLIVDAGLNLMRDALIGAATDVRIRYVALGTSSTAPASSDTRLGTEVFRKPVTSQIAGGSAGQAITTVYISPQDANVGIQEIGWFAGPSATATANSGVMIARVLYAHTHTNLESINIQRADSGI